jgi:hypothetical protein
MSKYNILIKLFAPNLRVDMLYVDTVQAEDGGVVSVGCPVCTISFTEHLPENDHNIFKIQYIYISVYMHISVHIW